MATESSEIRKFVARLARQLLDGEISFETFLESLPLEVENTDDEAIAELLDRLEHEPAGGTLLGFEIGATQNERQIYKDAIADCLALLEAGGEPR